MPLYAVHRMNKVSNRIPEIDDLFQVVEEDGKRVVHMDERIVLAIDTFGSRMAQSLRMSFLQGLGADAKLEKGLEGAMALDIVENKMPLLNLAGDIFGFNTKKYIAKNPRALGQLLKLAAPYLQNFNLGSMGNNDQTMQKGNVPLMR